jgi:hypothetical protein
VTYIGSIPGGTRHGRWEYEKAVIPFVTVLLFVFAAADMRHKNSVVYGTEGGHPSAIERLVRFGGVAMCSLVVFVDFTSQLVALERHLAARVLKGAGREDTLVFRSVIWVLRRIESRF